MRPIQFSQSKRMVARIAVVGALLAVPVTALAAPAFATPHPPAPPWSGEEWEGNGDWQDWGDQGEGTGDYHGDEAWGDDGGPEDWGGDGGGEEWEHYGR